jgi:hypothetical protein
MAREITCEVIATIKTEQIADGELRLQVVSWNQGQRKLEYRRYFEHASGEMRPAKLVGIDADTLQLIEENLDKIKKALEK